MIDFPEPCVSDQLITTVPGITVAFVHSEIPVWVPVTVPLVCEAVVSPRGTRVAVVPNESPDIALLVKVPWSLCPSIILEYR